ncbi:MAG: PorT family protein [Sphingobacteriaceae bacterium]|nr:MAG: PorT family protein [Sphingobacteriaceae bacterium]
MMLISAFRKRIYITVVFLMMHQLLQAQTVRFGAKTGINFASISAYNNPTSSVYQSKIYTNIKIGEVTEIGWTKFAIQTGLVLNGKGGIDTYINPETNTNRRKNTRLYYLEIPVNFLYKLPVKVGTLLLGGGPYAAYGIAGSYSLSGIIFDSPIDGKNRVNFGNNENSDYKRTDYGLNLRTEIRLLHGIGFELNYEYGLKNIATPSVYDDVGIKTRNSVFGIAISYIFGNR